jgi:hypothetical protein
MAAVERLKGGRTERVPEHLRPDLILLESDTRSNLVERFLDVGNHATGSRREE